MKILNRGYLFLIYKEAFYEWSNKYNDIAFSYGELESSVYLIEEDFMEEDKVIEGLFKKIMDVEFTAVCEEEEEWPALTRETFDQFFDCILGGSVVDTVKKPIQGEEL